LQAGDAKHRAYDLTDTIEITVETPTDPESPTSVVDEYDTNNDGEISIGEISTAAADFIDGDLSIQAISQIAAEFIN
jgi:Ca2+-binding EF-hand superfamily protein